MKKKPNQRFSKNDLIGSPKFGFLFGLFSGLIRFIVRFSIRLVRSLVRFDLHLLCSSINGTADYNDIDDDDSTYLYIKSFQLNKLSS